MSEYKLVKPDCGVRRLGPVVINLDSIMPTAGYIVVGLGLNSDATGGDFYCQVMPLVVSDPETGEGHIEYLCRTESASSYIGRIYSGNRATLTVSATGTIKRYAKQDYTQSPSTEAINNTYSIDWLLNSLTSEPHGQARTVFEDRVESYTYTVSFGTTTFSFEKVPLNQTGVGIGIEAACSTPGSSGGFNFSELDGQYYYPPSTNPSHVTASVGDDPGALWVSGSWSRKLGDEVENACQINRSYHYHHAGEGDNFIGYTETHNIVGNTFETWWGVGGDDTHSGWIFAGPYGDGNPGPNTYLHIYDCLGPCTVNESPDLKNMDEGAITTGSSSIQGVEIKPHLIQEVVLETTGDHIGEPWPTEAGVSVIYNSDSCPVSALSHTWTDANGQLWPPETTWPVHYTGKLIYTCTAPLPHAAVSEIYNDTPYPDSVEYGKTVFQHGNRRILGVRPTWNGTSWVEGARKAPAHPPWPPSPDSSAYSNSIDTNLITDPLPITGVPYVKEFAVPTGATSMRFYFEYLNFDQFSTPATGYITIATPTDSVTIVDYSDTPFWSEWMGCAPGDPHTFTYLSVNGVDPQGYWISKIEYQTGVPALAGDYYDEIALMTCVDDYLYKTDALTINLSANTCAATGGVVATPITFSQVLTYAATGCTYTTTGSVLTVNTTGSEASIEATNARSSNIRLTGTRYANVNWSSSKAASGTINIGSHSWALTGSASGNHTTRIDLCKPTTSTNVSGGIQQSIIPYDKPLDKSNGGVRQDDSYYNYEYPVGWAVGRLMSLSIDCPTPNTTYTFTSIDLYKMSTASGGFVKLYVVPQSGPWNDSVSLTDLAWFDSGDNTYVIRKGFLVVDGAVVWELISGYVKSDLNVRLYKLNTPMASGGIGYPLNSYVSPSSYGCNGVVASTVMSSAFTGFLLDNCLVSSLVGGVYTPTSGSIKVPMRNQPRWWYVTPGMSYLPSGSYHRYNGMVQGLAWNSDNSAYNGTITQTLTGASPGVDIFDSTTANALGWFDDLDACNTKGTAMIDSAYPSGPTCTLLRNRHYQRVARVANTCPHLALRYCISTGRLVRGPSGELALTCCS